MLNGIVSPRPDGLMLLEDALQLWSWLVGMRRAVPPHRWIDDWRADDDFASMTGLL